MAREGRLYLEMGRLRKTNNIRVALILIFAFAAAAAIASTVEGPFGKHDKAFYATEAMVNFVRPGLVLKITGVTIAQDGTITANFTIADPKGMPLDRDGVFTPGAVSVSFIAAYIPKNQSQFFAYTTRIQTSPITNQSATQASTDSGGVFTKIADGQYTYTFKTKVPADFDRTATHRIGAYSSRNLTEFDMGTQFSDSVFTFVPDGSKVQQVREVVNTNTCNQCHNPLSAHGGARYMVDLCIMCHTPQSSDPDTGNTVDFKVMVHKIHNGKDLPSVKAGGKYQIIGYNQTVVDFSHVAFPNDVRNCTVCHKDGVAAQSNAYLKPNRAACGSCHDDVNFATGENHVNLPQVSDNQCSTCHIPQGELEFDASILGAHTIPKFSSQVPGIVFELLKVDDGVAGKSPTVTFSVKDKSGNPINPATMNRIALVLSGPTSDYAAMVSEDASKATCGSDGVCSYTFAYKIPASATGSYSIGIEGRNMYTLNPGTKKEMTTEVGGVNKVVTFSVDGSPVQQRRMVVAIEKCNGCHGNLTMHGENRNQTVMCVLCHNPNMTDVARRPANAGPPQTVDFRTMIHKIHTGSDLNSEYTVYGFGGSKHDFTEVEFPGDRRDCGTCHINNSYQLPLRSNLLPVQTPRGYMPATGPTAAACLACHTTQSAASHAMAMTSSIGESCAVCHAPDADFAIDKVHAR